MAMATGELLLASLLVVAGTVALIPSVVGINTPQGFIQYFVTSTSNTLGKSPLSGYLSFLEFGVGALLMLSAFYVLRQAAFNLRAADILVKPRES
jgi:hypothetical protein